VTKHFDKSLNYALLNEQGKMIFIEAFEARINAPFLHPKLKRKTTYKSAIKYDAYKLVKFLVEDKPFVPFKLKDKH
jgi:CRISPR-associated protein Cas1